jgi:hypothetical protein
MRKSQPSLSTYYTSVLPGPIFIKRGGLFLRAFREAYSSSRPSIHASHRIITWRAGLRVKIKIY